MLCPFLCGLSNVMFSQYLYSTTTCSINRIKKLKSNLSFFLQHGTFKLPLTYLCYFNVRLECFFSMFYQKKIHWNIEMYCYMYNTIISKHNIYIYINKLLFSSGKKCFVLYFVIYFVARLN